MCEPTTIAALTFAVALASAGTAVYAQSQNARAQTEVSNQGLAAAQQAARTGYEQTGLQRGQERDQASQAENQSVGQEAYAEAASRAIGAESGVGGTTFDNLLADIARQGNDQQQAIRTNLANDNIALDYQDKGLNAQAISRGNSIQPGTFNKFAAGLSLLSSTADAYGDYRVNSGKSRTKFGTS